MRRNSSQREQIIGFIRQTTSHPTAQNVFDKLKKKIPSLSLGNTYRNIKILVEEGRVIARKFNDGIERYDAIIKSHYHFVCQKCGSVSDFTMPFQEHVVQEARKFSKLVILNHTIEFLGICFKCSKKKSKKQLRRFPHERQ